MIIYSVCLYETTPAFKKFLLSLHDVEINNDELSSLDYLAPLFIVPLPPPCNCEPTPQ